MVIAVPGIARGDLVIPRPSLNVSDSDVYYVPTVATVGGIVPLRACNADDAADADPANVELSFVKVRQ